ncbi:unnamed protein product [Auanema sp. JU1783]|nr:unnamed protein product [Auanema sp. JU1783]
MIRPLLRRCSTKPSSNEPSIQEALDYLRNKIREGPHDEEEKKSILRRRSWALAPSVLALSKKTPPSVTLVWPKFPRRNVIISLSSYNYYSAEVLAVLYSLVLSVYCKDETLKIYSGNETVVRVGNGLNKPTKERKNLDKIRSCVLTDDGSKSVQAQLILLTDEYLKFFKINPNNLSDLPFKYCTEEEFREELGSALVRI